MITRVTDTAMGDTYSKLQDAVSHYRRVKSQELLTREKLPQVETKK